MAIDKDHKIRVLVVDDSTTVRITASRMFGSGFDVILAVDGEDAFEIIERDTKIQVVFSDLVMPKMDGFELLSAVRSHSEDRIKQLPIIIMTSAENASAAKQKAISHGATDFVPKPFNAVSLRELATSYASLNVDDTETVKDATIDDITGLLNNKGIEQKLRKDLSFCIQNNTHLNVMQIEIDGYKDLFISMGRLAIEALLTHIANLLKESLRKEDSIARTGVATFTIIAPLLSAEDAMESAYNICNKVEAVKAKLHNKPLHLSTCVGIFHSTPTDDLSPEEAMEMAENTLSRAQHSGIGQFSLSSESDREKNRPASSEKISIDTLLTHIEKGNEIAIANQLDKALEQLSPLFALLSNEQKQHIYDYR